MIRNSKLLYIALDKFEKTPIPLGAWLLAAKQCEEVIVEEEYRHGKSRPFVVLKCDESARLDLGPDGLVRARNPSRELTVAMFKLSGILNAGVYSERRNRYRSVEHIDQQMKHREKSRKSRRLRIIFWILMAVLFVGCLWLVFHFILFIEDSVLETSLIQRKH